MELNLDKSQWVKVQFGDVVQKVSNKIDPEKYHSEIIIQGGHINKRDFHIREYENKNQLGYLGPAFHMGFKKHQILYVSRNPHLMKVGYPDFDGICANTTFIMETKDESVLRNDLIPFIMHSDTFIEQSVANVRGGVNPYVNWSDLACIKFLLPPKDQQAQLAKLLWAMDDVIEGSWKMMESAKAYKKRIAYDCYYSEDVEKVYLEDLTNKIQDGSHFSPKTIFPENDGSKFRYVTSKNIRVTGIEFKENQYVDKEFHDSIFPRCDVRFGDVLLTKDGANTGTATINSLEEEFSLLSSVCLIRSNDRTSNEYLCQYINSEIGNYNLVNQMTGTAITRLTLTTLRKIKIPIPEKVLQDQVVNTLKSIDKAIDSAIFSIEKGKTLQKSLINQVF